MRTSLHVVGMFVFGAAAIFCVALLRNARLERPFPVSSSNPAETPIGTSGSLRHESTQSGRLDAALAGIRADLEFFRSAVEENRSDAVTALDGAYRTAIVLRSAADGEPVGSLFASIDDARVALQNGNVARAFAAAAQGSALASAPAAQISIREPDATAPYTGAEVLGPTGAIVGTVASATEGELQVERGGLRKLLGFIDLTSGRIQNVPVDEVIFGAPRRLGPTMVIDTRR